MDEEFEAAKSEYRERVVWVLAGYQFIEAILKTFISHYFNIVRARVGEDLHFGFSGQDYSNAPLGALVRTFARISADAQLIADLRAEIPHRDALAHQSLMILYQNAHPSPEAFREMCANLSPRGAAVESLVLRLQSAYAELP